ALLRDGVEIRGGARDLNVEQTADGIRLSVDAGETPWNATVDRLVVAVGRAPNVDHLGLDAAGVEFSSKGIRVDDRLRTTNRRIFAAGDVASQYQFTHAADFMARIVIGNALFFGRSKASGLTIPWCTYTDPELAHVGKTAARLSEEGADFQTFTVRMDEVDRAILDGEDEGFVRVHADRKGRILGATVAAAHAGDMIGEISLAMTNGLGLSAIAKSIHPYPTQSEAIRKVGDLYNRTRLTPTVKWAMNKFLAWRR
ncbi:MAG: FAD-dependent oxidoreductase, partial [Planctomycetales bacterium]